MRLKSGCSGFNKKFRSSGLIELGTAKATERFSRTQWLPISVVSKEGIESLQFSGNCFSGKISVRVSAHSTRNALYVSEMGKEGCGRKSPARPSTGVR